MGVDHSQKVKAPPIGSDYSSKDCVNLSSSTAVFRIIQSLLIGGAKDDYSKNKSENRLYTRVWYTLERLQRLYHKPKTVLIDLALKKYEDQILLKEIYEGYARLKADKKAWGEELKERLLIMNRRSEKIAIVNEKTMD